MAAWERLAAILEGGLGGYDGLDGAVDGGSLTSAEWCTFGAELFSGFGDNERDGIGRGVSVCERPPPVA